MAFSGHLAFVMFVGAARADADPAQRDRLKAEIPPLLEEYVHGGSPEVIATALRAAAANLEAGCGR